MADKLTYFPLLIDRWVSGTIDLGQENSLERITLCGAYIELLIWLYDHHSVIKDTAHVARILRIDPRSSRKLWAKLEPKFLKLRHGYTHKLVAQILKNRGRIKELQDLETCLQSVYHIHTEIEPEPEIEKEIIKEDALPVGNESPADAGHKPNGVPYKKFEHWYTEHCPHQTKIIATSWTPTRKGLVRNAWLKNPDEEWWESFFEYCGTVKFLNGENNRSWKASLFWILKSENFAKVTERTYK